MTSLNPKFAGTVLPFLLCLNCLTGLFGSCGKHNRVDKEVILTSPCILVSQPSQHNGEQIRLTGYVTSTKEGAYMWGEECRNSGVLLHIVDPLARDDEFGRLLMHYGLAPSPMKATLVGRFQYSWFSGVKTFYAEQLVNVQVNNLTGEADKPPRD